MLALLSGALCEHSVGWNCLPVVFITPVRRVSFPLYRKGKGDPERINKATWPVGSEVELGSRVQALPTLLRGLHALDVSAVPRPVHLPALLCGPYHLLRPSHLKCYPPLETFFLSSQEVRYFFFYF